MRLVFLIGLRAKTRLIGIAAERASRSYTNVPFIPSDVNNNVLSLLTEFNVIGTIGRTAAVVPNEAPRGIILAVFSTFRPR